MQEVEHSSYQAVRKKFLRQDLLVKRRSCFDMFCQFWDVNVGKFDSGSRGRCNAKNVVAPQVEKCIPIVVVHISELACIYVYPVPSMSF